MRSVVLLSFLYVAVVSVAGQAGLVTPPPLQTPDPSPTPPTSTTPEPEQNVLPLAKECDEELCKLPDCRCSSVNIPGGLLPRDTPQFVTITFGDGVNVVNIQTYREILYGRRNSDGCPAGATFYVTHEYTNYALVNELYNQGFEIGLNSISHRTPQTYWAEANYNILKEEIADQKYQISHFANIPIDSIKGVRLPFLQLSGNASFQVMADYGLEYDNTWSTNSFRSPGLWPYTLDYASTQDCMNPSCPTASIPKTWVLPIVSWTDTEGFPCAMAHTCFYGPNVNDEDAWFEFIVTNFEAQYLGNRAPFGFHINEWYLATNPAVKAAFVRFLDLISNLYDAFIVNSKEVIDWVKNPIPVNEYRNKGCKVWETKPCPLTNCGDLPSEHNQMRYWMQACTGNVCPRVYPWTGNPLGL